MITGLKKVYGILLAAAVITILLLTFQDAEGTVRLSEGLRHLLEQFGLEMTFHGIRSNAHLVVYFILGVVLTLYGRECGWKWWIIVLAGCLFGVFDEGIKVFLPTREFDALDLMRDWIGIALAVGASLIRISKAAAEEKEQDKRSPKGAVI